ncbi:MAG: PQQ-dependent sugar dehydrogenase [Planctomycetota bacterium]
MFRTQFCITFVVLVAPLASAQVMGPFLDGAFPSSRPGSVPNASWSVSDALPSLRFREPLRVDPHPNGNQLIVASKDGDLWLVNDDVNATNKALFLHVEAQYPVSNEGGISGFAFHPRFGQAGSPFRGHVFVWYRWAPTPGPASFSSPGYQRLSRFTVPDGWSVVDPASEEVLIQQYDREQVHVGGDIGFGTDGFLYVPLGDEGNAYSRVFSTQRIDLGMFSGVLRIDVDQDPTKSHPIRRQPRCVDTPPPSGWPSSFSQGYGIPNDNPWLDPGGSVLEEFYSLGFRHPYTMQLDPDTGSFWVGDVGEVSREEVNRLERGANYQWAFGEGTLPGLLGRPGNVIGYERGPDWEYDHSQGQAIILSGMYRGSLFPELFGRVLFYDFLTGRFWALDPAPPSGSPNVELLGMLPAGYLGGLTSFAHMLDGRVLATRTNGGLSDYGQIVQLVRSGAEGAEPPALLSQTGFFTNMSTLVPHPGALAYSLKAPLWSDGAGKLRWMCIPSDGVVDSPGERISRNDVDAWEFPIGTVLVKHFQKGLDETIVGGPTRRLETRFLVHGTDGWYGVTYRWRPDHSDADLLVDAEQEVLTVATQTGTINQTWSYPSRLDCMRCHNDVANSVLGLKTGQLNHNLAGHNQLVLLDLLGRLDPPLGDTSVESLPRLSSLNEVTAPRADRVRSYLDANCAGCHRPGGVSGEFDARFSTPLCEQNILFGHVHESQGITGAGVVVPGHPARSLMLVRAASTGVLGMPPLAKDRVDQNFVRMLADWIAEVDDEIVIGNVVDTAAPFLDEHQPGLRVNEDDAYTHNDTHVGFVHPTSVRFHARGPGNPITPFLALWNGEDDVTVVAIGDTRVAGEYVAGENEFPFRNHGAPNIALSPGERLVSGFLDAFPNGGGWGAGSPIPAVYGPGQDEHWALFPAPLVSSAEPFDPSVDVPRLIEGQTPLAANSGLALSVHTALERSYRFQIALRQGCAPEAGSSEDPGPLPPFGGDPTTDAGHLDAWTSNLLVLTGAGFHNESNVTELLRLDQVSFYARVLADPITPFCVRVDGTGAFTVLAVGTTRTSYGVGANTFSFTDGETPLVTAAPSEYLAVGFLDAYPDGSGGGAGAAIPSDLGSGDVVWRSGGPSAQDSGSVAVGQSLSPGSQIAPNELRDVRFRVTATRLDPTTLGASSLSPVGTTVDPWVSNMVVDLGSTWTNQATLPRRVRIDQARFHAAAVTDPWTPFVLKLEGNQPGDVVAIGNTRTNYSTGLNVVAFTNSGPRHVDVNPGETLAVGFLDAFPNGTGGGAGSVVPVEFGTSGSYWVSGGSTADDSGSVSLGSPPTPGSMLLPQQSRRYPFSIDLVAVEFLPPDCDGDSVADADEPDCNQNGVPDDCEDLPDCNGNGIPDTCDLLSGVLGWSTPYGMGTSGTGGWTPVLEVAGCLQVGPFFELRLSGVLGGAHTFTVLSPQLISYPVAGGTLLAAPPFLAVLVRVADGIGPGAGNFSVPVGFGQLASVPGQRFHLQALALDSGAPNGVAFSQGLAVAPPYAQ